MTAAPTVDVTSPEAIDTHRVLEVEHVVIDYALRNDGHEAAVRDVSLGAAAGEIVALVGESGSGKTSLARAVVGLLPPNAVVGQGSRIRLAGIDIVGAGHSQMDRLRGSVAGFVPQDSRRSLHPLKKIGAQIGEVLKTHRMCGRKELPERVQGLLAKVGIDDPAGRAEQYPHEFSGGMLQRVLIAIAIAAEPRLVVADEPTSALDVTVQKQILDLIRELVDRDGLSVLLVTHDLEIAAKYSDFTNVMRHGRLVESRSTQSVFRAPENEYTKSLLNASPRIQIRPRQLSTEGAPGGEVLRVEDVHRGVVLHGKGAKRDRQVFKTVDGVSLVVRPRSTVAVVGESGAGKTSLGRLVLGLDHPTEGRVMFRERSVHQLKGDAYRAFRRSTQLIPQSPATTFDPRYSVTKIVAEPLLANGVATKAVGHAVGELLDDVGLPASFADKSGLELSGGQQQRVAIARAISLGPELIVCDEPTSALDVTAQARIIDLLRRLQADRGVSYLLISHNLALVSEIADEIVVMRRGRVVEAGPSAEVLSNPQANYTRELLDAVPSR